MHHDADCHRIRRSKDRRGSRQSQGACAAGRPYRPLKYCTGELKGLSAGRLQQHLLLPSVVLLCRTAAYKHHGQISPFSAQPLYCAFTENVTSGPSVRLTCYHFAKFAPWKLGRPDTQGLQAMRAYHTKLICFTSSRYPRPQERRTSGPQARRPVGFDTTCCLLTCQWLILKYRGTSINLVVGTEDQAGGHSEGHEDRGDSASRLGHPRARHWANELWTNGLPNNAGLTPRKMSDVTSRCAGLCVKRGSIAIPPETKCM
jgi:hypothetical protein